MKPLVLLLTLTAALSCSALLAKPGPSGNDKPGTHQIASPITPTVGSPLRADERISVDFPDNPIPEVLNNVAARFGYTVAISESFRGRTSIKLRDVTWIQVFREVLTPLGYDFYPDGDIIRVIGPSDPPAPLVKREYRCIFGSPADFAEVASLGFAAIGKGRAEILGQTVEIWADWRHALDLDANFNGWDRPRRVFPESIYFPLELPPEFARPDTGSQTPQSSLSASVLADGPSYTIEFQFEWVDAHLAAKIIHSLLTESGDSVRQGHSANSLSITFIITPWKHGMIEDLCDYLDDRKWYLMPEERERVAELAAKTNATPERVFTPGESAALAAKNSSIAHREKANLISVDFRNEERTTILRNVAQHFGHTVEFPPNFQGRTSIKLRNVTCWQIFREVLTPIDCSYYPDGTTIHVISRDSPPPPQVYREYTCVFRTADEFVQSFARQFANADRGRHEVAGRTVKVWISWLRAEKLDSIFESWDRPMFYFPATIRWPDTLPCELLELSPDTSTDRAESIPHIRRANGETTTEIFILNWVSANGVASRLRPLINQTRDGVQVDDRYNALIVTTDSKRHEIIHRVCRFLDDRKWYLNPAECEKEPTPK